MGLSNDGECEDVFYRRRSVSQMNGTNGCHGLLNTNDPDGKGNHFRFSGSVMVWSAGPDRKINPDAAADQGKNRDNIPSWQ